MALPVEYRLSCYALVAMVNNRYRVRVAFAKVPSGDLNIAVDQLPATDLTFAGRAQVEAHRSGQIVP